MPNRRPYRSVTRDEQARQTRADVVAAASESFADRGYAGTTMRQIAEAAKVSLPTVEQLFGTKANLLKTCIDVAIAGDDKQVTMLERDWTLAAEGAADVNSFLDVFVSVLRPAQARSAALIAAVFEGSRSDPDLADLARRLNDQRLTMARWTVEQLTRVHPLRSGVTARDAIDTVWLLMDPTVYDRLTRQRHRAPSYYQRWIADAIARLLVDHRTPPTDTRRRP